MQHPGFFDRAGPFSIAEVAQRCGAELGAGVDGDRLIKDVKPLSDAGPEDISFLDNRKYLPQLAATNAGACLILPALARLGLPVALGGTSNHFRRDALVASGGWDAWNVTEDADLGLRLARLGRRVGTWPQMTTIGIESIIASVIGVTMLVAPGPEVTSATPHFPVERA